MGCGMGLCAVLSSYLDDREGILARRSTLPEDCQDCLRLNEEDRKEKKRRNKNEVGS